MPRIILRCTQTVAFGKWDDKLEQERGFGAAEARLGSAATRQYQPMLSGDPQMIYIKEWEYDSLAQMEQAWETLLADPERQALSAENTEKGITIEHRWQVFTLLPPQ